MKSKIFAMIVLAWAGSHLGFAQDESFSKRMEDFKSSSAVINETEQAITIQSSINLISDIELPAQETGQLDLLNVREGQFVKKGDVIGKIDDRLAQRALEEAKFKLEAAQEKASDMAGINGAQARLKLYSDELKTKQRLVVGGNVTGEDFRKAEAQKDIAVYDLSKANSEKSLAEIETKVESVKLNAANDSIDRHLLKSPVDGYVFETFKEAKEWVNAGEKVVRIGRLDRVRVVGFIPASRYTPEQINGLPVIVWADIPGYKEPQSFNGTIVFAKPDQTVGSEFQVWAEIENRPSEKGEWILYKGVNVRMEIRLQR